MSKRRPVPNHFYMVHLSDGAWPPRVKHRTLTEAIEEAARLSKKFGKPATVLMTIIRAETEGEKVNLVEVKPES
jgi:hypothetical protein